MHVTIYDYGNVWQTKSKAGNNAIMIQISKLGVVKNKKRLKALKIVAKRQMSSCGIKLFLILVQYSLMKFKVSQYWSWIKNLY